MFPPSMFGNAGSDLLSPDGHCRPNGIVFRAFSKYLFPTSAATTAAAQALLDTLGRRGYDTVDRANRAKAGKMETKTVDPYYEWLGIPPKDQPPNHYRLLGLELFEENRNVIDAAANRQMSFIKEYQAGADSALSQKLLNQLSAARICLLSPATKAAYDEQLRAKLQAQSTPAPAEQAPSANRWRRESSPSYSPANGSPPAGQPTTAAASSAATASGAKPGPVSVEPPPLVAPGGLAGILHQSKTGFGALAVATGVVAAILFILLAFVVARSFRSEPSRLDHTVAGGSHERAAEIEQPESSVVEPVDSPSPPPEPAVPDVPAETQSPPPPLVLEPAEPLPDLPEQSVATPVMKPPTDQPAWPSETPPVPSVETLEQADERLKLAAEQASTPAEHKAVAHESLTIADKAIVESQADRAKGAAERALAAARKSESEDMVKQATLLWSELMQPLTDEVKERARHRLRQNKETGFEREP